MLEKEFSQLQDYDRGDGNLSFKCKEGDNKVRILAGGTPIAYHWFDENGKKKKVVCFGMSKGCSHHKVVDKKPTIQHLFYILDRSKQGSPIQLSEMPYTVFKAVKDYSENEEYAFSGFPMPYDITVTYNPAEAPATMYKIVASRTNQAVPKEILDDLATKKPVNEIVDERKQKAMVADGVEPKVEPEKELEEEEIDPEEIPF